MIPERVHLVTSMTLGRNKEYHTPVGDFAYYSLSQDSYAIGITQKTSSDFVGGFLMATPEKALADIVFKTCKGLDKEQLRLELLESKRIDESIFHQLNKAFLRDIARSYKSKSVNNLINLVGAI